MKILSTKEMRYLDEKYIREYGVSQDILMENAALGAYYFLKDKDLLSFSYTFFCGPGNNGGDGLALARKVFSTNKDVRVILTDSPNKYEGASRSNYSILKKLGVHIESIEDLDFDSIENISDNHVIVDALLGTGLVSLVRSPIKEVIDLINSANGYKLSLDIPSGLSSESGLPMGSAVMSHATISFGCPKYGNYIGEARKYIKEFSNCNISIGSEHTDKINTKLNIPEKLAERNSVGHKGTFGKALFIAGSNRYLGAPFFNCTSYIASGGGYSHLFSTPKVIDSVAPFSRETIFIEGQTNKNGNLSLDNLNKLLDTAAFSSIVAIGSGLSLDENTQELIRKFISNYQGNLIIDGDGFTALRDDASLLKNRRGNTILTPHLKEFAILSGRYLEEVARDRVKIASDFASEYNCYLILKDASTVIAAPSGEVLINPTGNSGLAFPGSGDLLVGILTSAVASFKLPPLEAASLAVFIHGFAGDLVRDKFSEEGVSSKELIAHIPLAIKDFRNNYKVIKERYSPKNM